MYENPALFRLRRRDEIERAVDEPRHVFRAVIVKVQPQEIEPPGLRGDDKRRLSIKIHTYTVRVEKRSPRSPHTNKLSVRG